MASMTFTVAVRDSTSSPAGRRVTGLTPTWVFLKKLADNSDVSQPSITEIAQGQYKFSYNAETTGEAAGQIDAGSSLTLDSDRYIDVLLTRDSSRISATATVLGGTVTGVTGNVGAVETFTDPSDGTVRVQNTISDALGNRTGSLK